MAYPPTFIASLELLLNYVDHGPLIYYRFEPRDKIINE